MNLIRRIEYESARFFFGHVFDNTVSTIIITAAVSSLSIFWLGTIVKLFIGNIFLALPALLVLCLLYFFVRHEKMILKMDFKCEDELKAWENHEIRTHIPSIATIIPDGLYLQFMDLPFSLKKELPENYALEFKSKVVNEVFSWCLNLTTESIGNLSGYMFQYNPAKQELRPHLFFGYNPSEKMTKWVLPESPYTPFDTYTGINLKLKKGWYSVRTEVRKLHSQNRSVDVDNPDIRELVPTYEDSSGNQIQFERKNSNTAIEIKIFDMNNYAQQVCQIIINEPPFKIFEGKNIGFRNYNLESAIYSRIRVMELSAL